MSRIFEGITLFLLNNLFDPHHNSYLLVVSVSTIRTIVFKIVASSYQRK